MLAARSQTLNKIIKNEKSILLIIATAGLFSCKQASKLKPETVDVETANSVKNVQNDKDIYTKYKYTDSNDKSITIQNGYLGCGIKYTDPNGNVCSYAVFWTRIINETDYPLELKIDLPITAFVRYQHWFGLKDVHRRTFVLNFNFIFSTFAKPCS